MLWQEREEQQAEGRDVLDYGGGGELRVGEWKVDTG